jgi:hypothetical protein
MQLRNRFVGVLLVLIFWGSVWTGSGAAQGNARCLFDNFVWFKDQEIINEIRKDVPSFDGTAPENGDLVPKILKALERLLKSKNLPSEVGYTFLNAGGLQLQAEHVFSANIAKVKVCKTTIINPGSALEPELLTSLKPLISRPYSMVASRTQVQTALLPTYRKYGHFRAVARSLDVEQDPTCPNGVAIRVTVEPGIAYLWNKAVWSGNKVFPSETLEQTLGMKSGDLANGVKLDAGFIAVSRLYGKQGYAGLQLQPVPEFDDASKSLLLKIIVTEGPQYRMGRLNVVGLSEPSAKMFKDVWRIKPGEVYDSTYPSEFIRRLGEVGGVPPDQLKRILTQTTPDQQKQTVDVTIDFNPRS